MRLHLISTCVGLAGLLAAALPATAAQAAAAPAECSLPTVQQSPLAQQLAACAEDAAGLRRRLQLMLESMLQEPELYNISSLPAPNLSLIPIHVEYGNGRYLGGVEWAAGNEQVRMRMSFFTAALPAAVDAASRLRRELILTDTLVHELTHCFFYFRYPKLAKQTEGEALVIAEGFAIHAARLMMERLYFAGSLPTEEYERIFLSARYACLYQEFRARYICPQTGRILFSLIDEQELRHAPKGYVLRNRSQI